MVDSQVGVPGRAVFGGRMIDRHDSEETRRKPRQIPHIIEAQQIPELAHNATILGLSRK